MEIKKENKFKAFFRKFGGYITLGVLVIGLTVTGLVLGLNANSIPEITDPEVDVSTTELKFALPMTNAEVLKDFSMTELQENITLGQWEAHFAMDLTSNDNLVYSVLDGKVIDVSYDYMQGNTITIQHDGGFVSVYGSLGDEVLVSVGDNVTTGQKLGIASNSATNELEDGNHLHFTLFKDKIKVDPNNYISFQNK